MKSSLKNIEAIQPTIFGENIKAFFTLKNKNYKQRKGEIDGLNVGYNTNTKDRIVLDNRKIIYREAAINPKKTVRAEQVHGNNVKFVSAAGVINNTDALITQTAGLTLVIQVADCAAILIHEPKSNTIAAVHAGWRGTVKGIIPNTMKNMKIHGANAVSAKAYISPCICVNHFAIGKEVAEQFPRLFIDNENFSKPHLNLKSFLKSKLIENGLSEQNIEVDKGCTIENEEDFYSYRREKKQSGRMLAVIRMNGTHRESAVDVR